MDIKQAKEEYHHMTTISIDNKPFVPLIKIKRTDALNANGIRVLLSKRRSNRIHYFMQKYSDKITVLNHNEESAND